VNKEPSPASNEWSDPETVREEERLLLERARAGDEEAFGDMVIRYQERVFRVAYRFVRNQDDAADMAQQAWIKAWKKLHTFRGNAAFFTWMYRIVSFVCLDHLRRQKRLAEFELPDTVEPSREVGAEMAASVSSRPDRELERVEIDRRFREGLETLSPEQRMALVMREVDGLSYEEIAKAMKCRKGTVMSRIFYARKNLQQHMGDLR
jgi:RNA polymerase sigma-70 factor, ECF subfamily